MTPTGDRTHHLMRLMRRPDRRSSLLRDRRGFNVVELMVTLAVIAIISAVGLPPFLSYWRSASLKGGAQELATILNRARQIAVSRNTTVCVKQAGNTVTILVNGCAGTVWTGPGTDSSGTIRLQNDVNVSATTANVVFNYLGAATTAGTYTVQDPIRHSTMSVIVASSGRVTIGP